ncbi:hypothetical protein C443_03234 [Haloarcula argentinensis DSM 12282]|nr:hypothetical protein C443_03234 [Haloarcula argentinensis DSM 12282]
MPAGTDAGVTPDSHAWPVFSVDTCDALGAEDQGVAPTGSAGHASLRRVTDGHASPLHRLLADFAFAGQVPAVVLASDVAGSPDVDHDASCWRLVLLDILF